jgi:hypothetical protein
LVDLSAWSGERVVYLAWYYEGQNADDWYIDDVDVRALQPDILLVEADAASVEPGGQTTVSITLENRSPMTAENLEVSLEMAVEEGVADGSQAVAILAQGEQTELLFTVDVAVDHLNNAYLPFSVNVSDGTSEWNFDSRLVVGDRTLAEIGFIVFDQSYVSGTLGVGDIDAPELSFVAFSGIFNAEEANQFSVDLTEYAALLPATAAERWWLKVDALEFGMVDEFELVTGDVVVDATVPHYFFGSFPEWIYLPEPPNPTIKESGTTPELLSPGSVADWGLGLVNLGEATSGVTTVTLSSTDPDLLFTGPTSSELSATGWIRNQQININTMIEISASKTDSIPILVDVVVSDEVETFERTASISVPWPVLEVSRVLIDDSSGGDGDGVLEPSESAELEIYLSNSGGRNTFSLVNCTLSQVGGVATTTLTSTSANFGVLSVGETEDEDGFEVEVTAGVLKDDIQFSLACSDGTEDYVAPFVLELGVPPWNIISTTRDSGADAESAYPLDLLSGKYRSDGTTLDIHLLSSTEFDSSTVFVEAWASSPGADYSWYQFVVQGGSAKVRGYDGKFHDLSTLGVDFPSAKEVVISVDIASLGLLQDEVSIGFASGFCGGSSYYCDHYPDAWGDPYNAGFFTSSWFDLRW